MEVTRETKETYNVLKTDVGTEFGGQQQRKWKDGKEQYEERIKTKYDDLCVEKANLKEHKMFLSSLNKKKI